MALLAQDLLADLAIADMAPIDTDYGNDRSQATRLGKALLDHNGRRFGNYILTRQPGHKGRTWHLQQVEGT